MENHLQQFKQGNGKKKKSLRLLARITSFKVLEARERKQKMRRD